MPIALVIFTYLSTWPRSISQNSSGDLLLARRRSLAEPLAELLRAKPKYRGRRHQNCDTGGDSDNMAMPFIVLLGN